MRGCVFRGAGGRAATPAAPSSTPPSDDEFGVRARARPLICASKSSLELRPSPAACGRPSDASVGFVDGAWKREIWLTCASVVLPVVSLVLTCV